MVYPILCIWMAELLLRQTKNKSLLWLVFCFWRMGFEAECRGAWEPSPTAPCGWYRKGAGLCCNTMKTNTVYPYAVWIDVTNGSQSEKSLLLRQKNDTVYTVSFFNEINPLDLWNTLRVWNIASQCEIRLAACRFILFHLML